MDVGMDRRIEWHGNRVAFAAYQRENARTWQTWGVVGPTWRETYPLNAKLRRSVYLYRDFVRVH